MLGGVLKPIRVGPRGKGADCEGDAGTVPPFENAETLASGKRGAGAIARAERLRLRLRGKQVPLQVMHDCKVMMKLPLLFHLCIPGQRDTPTQRGVVLGRSLREVCHGGGMRELTR